MKDTLRIPKKKSLKALFAPKGPRHGSVQHVVDDKPPAYSPPRAAHIVLGPAKEQVQVHSLTLEVPADTRKTPTRPEKKRKKGLWVAPIKEKPPGSYMFETTPTLVKTQWEHERNRRPAVQRPRQVRSSVVDPSYKLEELPVEVMHCIVDHLVKSHTTNGTTDVTRLQNDLCSFARASKRCNRVARAHLYHEVWLPSNEELRGRLRTLTKRPSPLACLEKTLNEAPWLAYLIKHLRLPYQLSREIFDQGSSASSEHGDETLRMIAKIISLCPSLEHFTGFSAPDFEGHFDVWQALASRPFLKSHCWGLDLDWDLDTRELIQHHANWQHLETLAICDTELGTGTLFGMIWHLSALKNLMLRGLYGSGVHCGTLLMLPALKSLRLEALPGIADEGLEKLISGKLAFSLEQLTLVDMDVQSLLTIQTLLDGFEQIKRFSLVQETAPCLDPELARELKELEIDFLLSSLSLEELCWDTENPDNAVAIIAESITAGEFPYLKKVRIPCDHDGAVQKLCRPIAQEVPDSVDEISLDSLESDRELQHRMLDLAHIRARRRTLESQDQPSINVVIQDENEDVQQTHVLGSYLGDVKSNIEYSLEPGMPGYQSVVPEFYSVVMPVLRDGCEQRLDLKMLF